jgi:hypothetical protein
MTLFFTLYLRVRKCHWFFLKAILSNCCLWTVVLEPPPTAWSPTLLWVSITRTSNNKGHFFHRTLTWEKWRLLFFLSDFSLTCGLGIIYYLFFSLCLQARTIFKPIQTLQVLKITLPLLTSSRFGRKFLGTGNSSFYLLTPCDWAGRSFLTISNYYNTIWQGPYFSLLVFIFAGGGWGRSRSCFPASLPRMLKSNGKED